VSILYIVLVLDWKRSIENYWCYIWIYYVLSVIVMETEAHNESQVEKWYFAGIYEDLTKIKDRYFKKYKWYIFQHWYLELIVRFHLNSSPLSSESVIQGLCIHVFSAEETTVDREGK